jgi:hypothetical protein
MNLHAKTQVGTESSEHQVPHARICAESEAASYDRSCRLVSAAVSGKMDVQAFSHQGIA